MITIIFNIAYWIPELRIWHCHKDCDYEQLSLIGRALLQIGRSFRVQCLTDSHKDLHVIEIQNGTEFAFLLNLFYIRLSGRTSKLTLGQE